MNTKECILKILEERRGEYVSGEEIARVSGVSRTAVWKGIAALKKEGLKLESLTGSGYMLPRHVNALSEQGIRKYLTARDIDIRVYQEADSTNNVAKKLAAEGARERTVIFACKQTGGKGRAGRKFYSPPEAGVYFTVILRPDVDKTPFLTVMAAVAVADGIEAAGGRHTRIKWVNDVYVEDKKCCGILTEAVADLESGGVEYAVTGIGINVTEPNGGFGPEIRDIAASACDGVEDARNKTAACVLNRFFELYDRFDRRTVAEAYRARSFVVGREITVVKGDVMRAARATGIDGNCRLQVEYDNGERETLSAGEVSLKL